MVVVEVQILLMEQTEALVVEEDIEEQHLEQESQDKGIAVV